MFHEYLNLLNRFRVATKKHDSVLNNIVKVAVFIWKYQARLWPQMLIKLKYYSKIIIQAMLTSIACACLFIVDGEFQYKNQGVLN